MPIAILLQLKGETEEEKGEESVEEDGDDEAPPVPAVVLVEFFEPGF